MASAMPKSSKRRKATLANRVHQYFGPPDFGIFPSTRVGRYGSNTTSCTRAFSTDGPENGHPKVNPSYHAFH